MLTGNMGGDSWQPLEPICLSAPRAIQYGCLPLPLSERCLCTASLLCEVKANLLVSSQGIFAPLLPPAPVKEALVHRVLVP